MNKVLLIVSTTGVQSYIFRSNKLKENIGASYLVKNALEEGLLDSMTMVDAKKWFCALEDIEKAEKYSRPQNQGEVIYMAGGNAVLILDDIRTAKEALFSWSRRLLENSPGLRVAAGLAEIDNQGLSSAYDRARKESDKNENAPPFGFPLPALPIVRTCTSTGQPAVCFEKTSKAYLSAEAFKKRSAVGSANHPGPAQDQANIDFQEFLGEDWIFPMEMEDLGGEEGQSRIAVVHIDGNDMGLELQNICQADLTDDEYTDALRSFSAGVKRSSLTAFKDVMRLLQHNLPKLKEDKSLAVKDGFFPLRPLVYGGDDITFVCDSRLGLPLAEHYLEQFCCQSIDVSEMERNIPLSACAGIAIVPSKFPFSRAYELAESLCGSAKRRRKEQENSHNSWLDFQVLFSGTDRGLDAMRRKRFCCVTGESLLFRPWPIDRESSSITWHDALQTINQLSAWPRSILKDFSSALAQGPSDTEIWLSANQSRGRSLPALGHAGKTGWQGSQTPYYDCLEIMENYLHLNTP